MLERKFTVIFDLFDENLLVSYMYKQLYMYCPCGLIHRISVTPLLIDFSLADLGRLSREGSFPC